MPEDMEVMSWSAFAAINGIVNETRKTGEAEDGLVISFVDQHDYCPPKVNGLFASNMIDWDDDLLLED